MPPGPTRAPAESIEEGRICLNKLVREDEGLAEPAAVLVVGLISSGTKSSPSPSRKCSCSCATLAARTGAPPTAVFRYLAKITPHFGQISCPAVSPPHFAAPGVHQRARLRM